MTRSGIILGAIILVCGQFASTLAEDSQKPLEDAPDAVKAFIKQSEFARSNFLSGFESRIESNRKLRDERMNWKINANLDEAKGTGPNGFYPSKAAKAEHLKSLDKEIAVDEGHVAAIRSIPLFTEFLVLSTDCEVGHFGTMKDHNCIVQQVIDDRNMLVEYSDIQVGRVGGGPIMWVTGVPTTGYVDGKGLELKQMFRVSGTKKYNTALGFAKTVRVLEPFDVSAALPFAPKPVVKAKTEDAKVPTKEQPAKEANPQTLSAQKLVLAKSLLKSNPAAAKKRLEEVIASYPETESAKEAKKLLDEMK